jgi:hypothetical protein
MFLRAKKRYKDGKEHRYWSIVENQRLPNGKVWQRQVSILVKSTTAKKPDGARPLMWSMEDMTSRPNLPFP